MATALDAETRLLSFDSDDPLPPDLRCRDHLAIVGVRERAAHEALVARVGLREIGAPLIRARLTADGVQLARGFSLYHLPRRTDLAGC